MVRALYESSFAIAELRSEIREGGADNQVRIKVRITLERITRGTARSVHGAISSDSDNQRDEQCPWYKRIAIICN